MVLDALYYSKFQKELQHIIQDCYNMKRVYFNFTPYNNDADSLELDYLILISACSINGKRIRLQDLYPYTDDQKAITSITSNKNDSKELVNSFLIELNKILMLPEISFSDVKIDLSKKDYSIENLKGLSSEKALFFLSWLLDYFHDISEQNENYIINAVKYIDNCATNEKIIDVLHSIVFVYDKEIYKALENSNNYIIEGFREGLELYVKAKRVQNFDFLDLITRENRNHLKDSMSNFYDSLYAVIRDTLSFQRLYYIFKLGFIASQSEPDLGKIYESLTPDC